MRLDHELAPRRRPEQLLALLALALEQHLVEAAPGASGPRECVSRWRMVTPSLSRSPKCGRCLATGSSRAMRPSSTSSRMAGVVAIILVSEARSKIVSRAIGMRSGADDGEAAHGHVLEPLALAGHAGQHDRPGHLRCIDGLVDRAIDLAELPLDQRVPQLPLTPCYPGRRVAPASRNRSSPAVAVDLGASPHGPREVRRCHVRKATRSPRECRVPRGSPAPPGRPWARCASDPRRP